MTKLPLLLAAATLSMAAYTEAATITKAGNTDELSLGSSWTGSVAPGTGDVAQFDTSIIGTGNNSYDFTSNLTWNQLRVDRATATAGGTETIGSSNGSTLTFTAFRALVDIGTTNNFVTQSGILLNSGAGASLVINSAVIFAPTSNSAALLTSSRSTTLNGTVGFGANTLDFFIAGSTTNIAGAMTGTGTVNKLGTGVLQLGGTNTAFTGPLKVLNGTLQITGSTNTGAGAITVGSGTAGTLTVGNGGTLTTTGLLTLGSGATTNAFNVNTGGVANVGSVNNAWGTDVTVDGTLNVTGGYTIATNTAKVIAGAGTINAASLSLSNAATTLNFTSTGALNLTGALTLSAGSSPVINQSAGTIGTSGLVLNGTTSTYALTGGRINIGSGGITGSGATKNINLGAGTVGARASDWSSSLAIALTNAGTGTTFNTLDSVDSVTGRTITLSGALSGAGKLIKAGAGTLALSGANTYSGGTTINAGTLATSTSNGALGTGAVTIDGGTLSVGAAGITGIASLTVNTGTLNTSSGGITTTGAFALVGGTWTLGNTVDGVTAGSFTLTGGSIDLFGFTNKSTAGTYSLIAGTGTSSLTNANFTNGDAGFTYSLDTNGDLFVTAVPEPSTYGMIGAGALAAVALVRRRRKAAGLVA